MLFSHPLTLLGFTLLISFLPPAHATDSHGHSLDQALRQHGLTLFADYLTTHPPSPSLLALPDLIVYAPTNAGMQAYLNANASADKAATDVDILLGHGKEDILAAAAPAVIKSGGEGIENNKVIEPRPAGNTTTTGAQESDPPPSWLARIYSGNGAVSYILAPGRIPFAGGSIYPIDKVFTPASPLPSALLAPANMNLTYLAILFERLPSVLPALAAEKSLTFLVPSLAAFAGSGIDLGNITAEHLAAHVDYAVLAEEDTGFIGYTPSLREGEGQTYLTRQGGRVLITKRGGEVWVGDARVVRRDCVVGNGVVHMIDKILELPASNATSLPGPDGPVRIDAGGGDRPSSTTKVAGVSSTVTDSGLATATGGAAAVRGEPAWVVFAAVVVVVAGFVVG